jgi:hypothetical protein
MRNLIVASTIAALAALSTTAAYADSSKAGPFVDFGITGSSYYSGDDYFFDTAMSGGTALGGVLAGGNLWDVGREEGFLIGVSAAFNSFGEVDGSIYGIPVSASAQALSVRANVEYSFGPRWSVGIFAGPALVYTQATYYEDDNFFGVTGGLAGMYSPTDRWTISLGYQVTEFENDYDYRYGATTAFLTGRYSF